MGMEGRGATEQKQDRLGGYMMLCAPSAGTIGFKQMEETFSHAVCMCARL